ncbi:MAG: dihydrofolate reductase, partial [Parvibaculum sp.]
YADMFDHATRLYITEVHAEPQGDVSFPAFDASQWREISRERHEAGEKDSAPYSFVLLERR